MLTLISYVMCLLQKIAPALIFQRHSVHDMKSEYVDRIFWLYRSYKSSTGAALASSVTFDLAIFLRTCTYM